MKRALILMSLAGVILALGSFMMPCGVFGHDGSTDDPGAIPEGIKKVVAANNQFALKLYPRLAEAGKNVFYSPYSISVILAMAYEGARGKTADEMRSVLQIPEDLVLRRSNFARMINEINMGNKSYTLSTANALWVQKDHALLKEFMEVTRKYYAAKASNLDFVKATEASRQTINRWVEEQTKGKIRELLQNENVTTLTKLILTNAIYFKGTWQRQFDKKKTKDDDFTTDTGKTVRVPMMRMLGEEFYYVDAGSLQALELPYKGGELSMLILLPKLGSSIKELETSISVKMLSRLRGALVKEEVHTYIPKFKLEERYPLSKALEAMGMTSAFTLGADFSGMDGGKDLYISDVIHQALVEVSEEGTEAAAATSVISAPTGPAGGMHASPPVFYADHPFMFFVQQRKTGNILFMGTVMNPKQ